MFVAIFCLLLSTTGKRYSAQHPLLRSHSSLPVLMVTEEAIMLVQRPTFWLVVWIRSGPTRIFSLDFLLLKMRVGTLPVPEAVRCNLGGADGLCGKLCKESCSAQRSRDERRALMVLESANAHIPA